MSADLAVLAADPSRLADADPADLPRLAGEAAALHALILARVVGAAASQRPAATASAPGRDRQTTADTLLTVAEAAARLGVGRRWVYRHADTLPFTRKLASGTLRFSERGLTRWAESRR